MRTAVLILACLANTQPPPAAPRCDVADLGSYPQEFFGGAGKGWSLSLDGKASGWVRRGSNNVAAVATLTAVQVLEDGRSWSVATGVSDAGHVVGYTSSLRAFLHDRRGRHDLGNLGSSNAVAMAVNDRGQVTGESHTKDGERHAFRWDGQGMKDLGTLGAGMSAGRGISPNGKVTGVAEVQGEAHHAFLWDGQGMKDLGTLGGNSSAGNAVNDRGWVTGTADRPDGRQAAFLWTGQNMVALLPADADAATSNGKGISPGGRVTGWVRRGNDTDAFFWDRERFHTLPALESKYHYAVGLRVTDDGTVLGISTGGDDKTHLVRWTCL